MKVPSLSSMPSLELRFYPKVPLMVFAACTALQKAYCPFPKPMRIAMRQWGGTENSSVLLRLIWWQGC